MEQNIALLVMDVQAEILGMLPEDKEYMDRVAYAIAYARAKKILVIYVVVGFRQGMPEATTKNKNLGVLKERFAKLNMDEFMKVHAAIEPMARDIIVTHRRVSAFTGSDLEVVLRAQDIQHVVLTGISTSGVVLSTTREAADKDYRITILSDCCLDADKEVHTVLTTKVFPRQADVMTLQEWSKQ